MEKESQLLEDIGVLESELSRLGVRLEPVTLSHAATPPPPAQPERARSEAGQRLTTMIRQLRDLQERLEV